MSRSNTEAKYRVMVDATLELRWLSDLLCDMGVSAVIPGPMHCDDKNAIAIASNLDFMIAQNIFGLTVILLIKNIKRQDYFSLCSFRSSVG